MFDEVWKGFSQSSGNLVLGLGDPSLCKTWGSRSMKNTYFGELWGLNYMGGCQNGPLNTRCRILLRTPKGTIVLTTAHM